MKFLVVSFDGWFPGPVRFSDASQPPRPALQIMVRRQADYRRNIKAAFPSSSTETTTRSCPTGTLLYQEANNEAGLSLGARVVDEIDFQVAA